VKRGNLTAFNLQQTSPVSVIEPLLCEFCIRLAKMGNPFTRETVIELANDLVKETKIATKISDCKQLQKLKDVAVLGVAWYRGFMHHYSSKLVNKEEYKYKRYKEKYMGEERTL
jgi:hypothetical protein